MLGLASHDDPKPGRVQFGRALGGLGRSAAA
jgi:hypothetical protein